MVIFLWQKQKTNTMWNKIILGHIPVSFAVYQKLSLLLLLLEKRSVFSWQFSTYFWNLAYLYTNKDDPIKDISHVQFFEIMQVYL